MARVFNDPPSASFYNKLPFIHDMEKVAEMHASDVEYLRNLLLIHHMPESVCVKLVHIHFHLAEGEILAARELDGGSHGKIPYLEPNPREAAGPIHGCSYAVNDSGQLQAFEYNVGEQEVDLTAYPAFVDAFCTAIVKRHLQRKFGIAILSGASAKGAWVELDFPESRATFLMPGSIELPKDDSIEMRATITKFPKPSVLPTKTHCHIEHEWSSKKDHNGDEAEPVDGVTTIGGLKLTGVPIEPGTAFFHVAMLVSAAAA